MIDYLCYVKKQYSKEKEYEKFLVGLTILMLIGYLITGDNLNLLFLFQNSIICLLCIYLEFHL